jgi:hypothetical protein
MQTRQMCSCLPLPCTHSTQGASHVVLVGDHFQLPPVVQSPAAGVSQLVKSIALIKAACSTARDMVAVE